MKRRDFIFSLGAMAALPLLSMEPTQSAPIKSESDRGYREILAPWKCVGYDPPAGRRVRWVRRDDTAEIWFEDGQWLFSLTQHPGREYWRPHLTFESVAAEVNGIVAHMAGRLANEFQVGQLVQVRWSSDPHYGKCGWVRRIRGVDHVGVALLDGRWLERSHTQLDIVG